MSENRDEIAHLQKLLQIQNKKRQQLEQQAAQYGLAVPVDITNQLENTRDEIKRLENKLTQLQSSTASVSMLSDPVVDHTTYFGKSYRTKPRCPYPGMSPFGAEDARYFYGRDREVRQMLQHLRHQRDLFVIGPSGSGKSSLISAGFLPRLQESSYFPPGFWLVREMRPGGHPLQNLTAALEVNPEQPTQGVAKLLTSHPPAQCVLLIIDPLEEIFTQAERDERNRFIECIQALQGAESCALLIAMRADFYPDLMNSDLWPIKHNQRLEIAPLRGNALRWAIEQPALDVGVRFQAELLEHLLTDAADEPGVLPLLQETMVLLWDEITDNMVPFRAYEQLGSEGRSGLAVAIAAKADFVVDELTPDQRAIARRIFLRLIQFGEGRADTRRQQAVADLQSTTDEPHLFRQTLHHLVGNRLITLSGKEGDINKQVDIAHEALISGWPTLQRWLTERREAEQTRRRLETKAHEWVRLGQGSGALLDEIQLLEAERWLDGPDAAELGYSETLVKLVEASKAAYKRQQELQKIMLAAVNNYFYVTEITEDDDYITTLSDQFETLTGYSKEYLASGWRFLPLSLIHSEDKYQAEIKAKELRTEQVSELEYRLVREDGEVIWIQDNAKQHSEGTSKIIYGIVSDISERKLAQAERERLLEAEREQRLLAETLGDVFLALTTQTSREAILDKILRQVERIVPYSAANLMFLRGDTLYIGQWQGYLAFGSEELFDGLQQRLTDFPLEAEVVQSRQPLIVPDTDQNPDWIAEKGLEWVRSSVILPIYLKEQVLGLLRLDSDQPQSFSDTDIERLQPLVNAAAIAFENAQLYDTTRQELAERKHRLLALQQAGTAISSSPDLAYVIDTVTREMINLLDVDGCAISEWDQAGDAVVTISEQALADWWDYQQPENKIFKLADYPLTRRVLTNRQAEQMTISQAELDAGELAYMQTTRIKTLVMLPMEFQDRVVGLVEILDSRVERTFSLDELALAQFLANQAATATENARLYAETNRRLKEQIALHEAAAVISSTLDLDSVLNHIVEQLGMVVDASSAYLCSYEPESMTSTVLFEYFSPRASEKELASDLHITYPLPRDFTINFDLLQTGRSEVIHIDDPHVSNYRHSHMKEYGAMTILNIPLRVGGRIIAFAELWESEYRREFSTEEINLCQAIAQQAAVALENARLYDQARQEIEERKQTEEGLRRMTEYSERLINSSLDGIFSFDRKCRYTVWNPIMEHIFGLSKAKVLGRCAFEVFPFLKETGEDGYFYETLTGKATIARERPYIILETGRTGFFEGYYSPIWDEADRVVGGLAIIRDITERKQAEQQLIRTERLTAIGRLSTTLAYELNNPLQVAQSNLDLILDFPLEPGESEKYLQIVRQEIQHLRDIAQRFLSYAHPKPELRQEVIIADLVQQVLELTNKRLEQTGTEVITHFEEVPPVVAARNQLVQVFLNLVINATEALEDDGKLEIAVYSEDGDVIISFTNNGPIIPEEILAHIFEPFFTTKSEGSGLGLWVSHSLVHQHSGSLIVENVGEERGVIFTVRLPAVVASVSEPD